MTPARRGNTRHLSRSGRILAAGTPGNVARDADSVTGMWLAEYLGAPAAGR